MDDTHVYFEKYSKKTGRLLKKVSLKNEEADFITHWIDIWVG